MQFTQPQRSLIVEAMDEAERRTTDYYCIPPFRWHQLRYDLITRADEEWNPIPDSVFAGVQCLRRTGRRGHFDFFRIQLNDPSILTAAERENLRDLYPFLVYILTHEMVHVVRLSSILAEWPDAPAADPSEEHRVHRISHQILAGSPSIRPVLDRFSLCNGFA
jgi:hypothetical protein